MTEVRPDVVIPNSLVRFTGRIDTNSAADMVPFWSIAIVPLSRDFEAAVVVLRHLQEPSWKDSHEGRQHRVRGSSDFPTSVSEVLVLKRETSGEEASALPDEVPRGSRARAAPARFRG